MIRRHVTSLLGMVLAVLAAPAAHAELKEIGSREYKVGLDPKSLSGAPEDVFKAIDAHFQSALPLQFGAASHGRVQFFDTKNCDLSHGSMLLRYRQKDGKPGRVTLKIRDADILAVDTSPLRPTQGKMPKIEDDFSIRATGVAASDFSKSFSYDGEHPQTVGELAEHLRHLDKVSKAVASDRFVGGPAVAETVYASKPVKLADRLVVIVEVSLWYGKETGKPLTGDVSFTVDGPFESQSLAVANTTLERIANSLGVMKGSSGEKALAVIPEQCR